MISIVAIYAFSVAFTCLFVMYSFHQFKDEDDGGGWTKAKARWHKYGLAMRVAVALMGAAWVYLPAPDPKYYFHALSFCPLVFDIGLNIVRGKPLFYYGAGGWDARVKNLKWGILFGTVIATTIFVITN
jgi:hypothetical protein